MGKLHNLIIPFSLVLSLSFCSPVFSILCITLRSFFFNLSYFSIHFFLSLFLFSAWVLWKEFSWLMILHFQVTDIINTTILYDIYDNSYSSKWWYKVFSESVNSDLYIPKQKWILDEILIFFQIVLMLTFNTCILVSFLLIKALLKLFFWSGVKLCNCIFLMFSKSSTSTPEMNFNLGNKKKLNFQLNFQFIF